MTTDWEFPKGNILNSHILILDAINYAGSQILGDNFRPRYVPWIPEGARCLTVLENDRRYREIAADPDRVGSYQPPTVWDITRACELMLTEGAALEDVTEGWPEAQRSDVQGLFNIRSYSLDAEMQAGAIFGAAVKLIWDGKLRSKAWVERSGHGAWTDVPDTYWGSRECRVVWYIPNDQTPALIDIDEVPEFGGKPGTGPLFWNKEDVDAAIAEAQGVARVKQPNQSTTNDRSAKVNEFMKGVADRLGDDLEVRADPKDNTSPMMRGWQDLENYVRFTLGGSRREYRMAWNTYFPDGKDGKQKKHQWRERGGARRKAGAREELPSFGDNA